MRERLDEHTRFLELQLAGLEVMIQEKGGKEPGQPSAEAVVESVAEDESKKSS